MFLYSFTDILNQSVSVNRIFSAKDPNPLPVDFLKFQEFQNGSRLHPKPNPGQTHFLCVIYSTVSEIWNFWFSIRMTSLACVRVWPCIYVIFLGTPLALEGCLCRSTHCKYGILTRKKLFVYKLHKTVHHRINEHECNTEMEEISNSKTW
jgi:hypothetical protein